MSQGDTPTYPEGATRHVTRRLTGDKKALIVEGDTPLADGTIDVLIDNRRVWSTRPPEPAGKGKLKLPWPKALHPYLHGTSVVTLRSSADGRVLATGQIQIGRSAEPIEVRDNHGRWLAVNKWSRLGPSFEGDDTGLQERLLNSAQRLVSDLQQLGYPVFVVGGTLLGAIRKGDLLPHDDDIDLAWVCREDNPLDIAIASLKMERQLVELGYTSIRLGLAHLQITFFDDDANTDHYVDIFTGFFMDGQYGQPFALRGDLKPDDLEPVSTVRIRDLEFPAPARPEAWLAFAYGPSWRVPDPSFTFVTPRSTIRRYENWFGVFNRGRVYWEKKFEKLVERPELTEGYDAVDQLLQLLPAGANVLDIGSSDGRVTERIARRARRVIGVDYSYAALRLARLSAPANVEYRYLNVNDRRALLEFGIDLIEEGEDWHISAIQLLAGVPLQGRQNFFLFLNLILTGNTFAFATFDTDFSRRYEPGKPDSWHYPLEWLQDESKPFGLSVELLHTGHRSSPLGRRATAMVIIRKVNTLASTTEESI